MQNNVISIGITSLYESQRSSAVFSWKAATFGSEFQVPMGSRPHLSFCARKTVCLAKEQRDYMGCNPHLWFCECKTATLWLELQDSVGPRPHPYLLHVKQRLLDRNNKSLLVPDMTGRFVLVQRRD